jgi:hypothetical protein
MATILFTGAQQVAFSAPLMVGSSLCWRPSPSGIWMRSYTWVESGVYPEVQVIGHITTITNPNPPYLQVFLNVQPNTIFGADRTDTWGAVALSGVYTITTAHGYIDDDGTEHEEFTTFWGCVI